MNGTTTSPDPGTDRPTGTAAIPKLRRSRTDRHVAGVAGGIGAYLGVDPVLVRILFAVAALAGGSGVLAYVLAWIFVPEDDGTSPTTASRADGSPDGARLVGLAALALAVVIAVEGRWWGDGVLVPLALIGGGLWLVLRPEPAPRPADAVAQPAAAPEQDAAPTPPPPARWAPPPVPPLPPLPRRRPWSRTTQITGGLVALLAGGLGIAATAGVDVSLEVALLACLALIAGGLLVGGFTGGARGLIGLAAPLLAALALVSAVDVPIDGGVGERHHAPEEVADVEGAYRLALGQMTLDLRGLQPDELDDPLPVEASIVMGELEVLTPADVTVDVRARADAGEIVLFGSRTDGTGLDVRGARDGQGGDVRTLTLDLRVGLGTVTVR